MNFFYLFVATVFATTPLSMHLSLPSSITPLQPILFESRFVDSTGKTLLDFELNHEKLNHTLLISKDLSQFSHLHPDLKSDGSFSILLNTPSTNIDNQDALTAIAKAGTYFVFSEVTPKGDSDSSLFRGQFLTTGLELMEPIAVDPLVGGLATKYFLADGKIGTINDTFKISFSIQSMPGMVHFIFRFEEIMNHGGMIHYMPVTNLEPWLGMLGHAILISAAGTTADEKIFHHLHLGGHHHMRDSAGHNHGTGAPALSGDKLEFMLMGNDAPPPGIYKIWGQFKYKGQVMTFPFVFEL